MLDTLEENSFVNDFWEKRYFTEDPVWSADLSILSQ